jgi:lipopolysaccharide transport system ATP-binding protein
MEDPIIKVKNLGKSYLVGHQKAVRERYTAMRDVLATSAKKFFRKTNDIILGKQVIQGDEIEEFWALRHVSFDVKRGEVVGIIGRNGAGKSTLLKILSRITEPTEGRVSIKGRIASLLEVGTGFHPELSGRENIFLNGAILGMTKAEIRAKFDEIVDFAGVEQFIDTPVKRYSSGMYVRLAFAVAAHLEPEILIVDEVLAVGDAEFQKKCLGKMKDVAGHGRTILFVSHNIQAMQQLCDRAVLMDKGKVSYLGNIPTAIEKYLGYNQTGAAELDLREFSRTSNPQNGRFTQLRFFDQSGTLTTRIDRNQSLNINVQISLYTAVTEFDFTMALVHGEGTRVFSEVLSDNFIKENLSEGSYSISFSIPCHYLKIGHYSLTICALHGGRVIDFIEGIPIPEIIDQNIDKSIEMHRWGVVRIPLVWNNIIKNK